MVILSSSSPGDTSTVTTGGTPAVCWRRASAIRRKTPSQSPGLSWRKRRRRGYHGESPRPSSQRQSGTAASASQQGTPNAPARWPTAVSQQTTRSRHDSTAAVSTKGPLASSSPGNSATGKRPARARACSLPAPFWRLTSRTPSTRASGSKVLQRDGTRVIAFVLVAALPGDADSQGRGDPASTAWQIGQPAPPMLDEGRIGAEVGHVGGDGLQVRAEQQRQAQQRRRGCRTAATDRPGPRAGRCRDSPAAGELAAAGRRRRRSRRAASPGGRSG